ncbi:hypothetical protein BD289DRAFT_72859 [Coniella lustricola]|uniref:Uncharacterized protein n=1 Tax=Coniella lustricola TaxID=2025994 RepID=A0A2T2ZZQ1_9PEZI|nr:hypothetical protein BD289DRAFT_72859 [Coniella lustricola]
MHNAVHHPRPPGTTNIGTFTANCTTSMFFPHKAACQLSRHDSIHRFSRPPSPLRCCSLAGRGYRNHSSQRATVLTRLQYGSQKASLAALCASPAYAIVCSKKAQLYFSSARLACQTERLLSAATQSIGRTYPWTVFDQSLDSLLRPTAFLRDH